MGTERRNVTKNIVIDEHDGLICKYWVHSDNWLSDANRYDVDFGVTIYNSYGKSVDVGSAYIDTGHRTRTEEFSQAVAEIDGLIGALQEARTALITEYNRLLDLAAAKGGNANKETTND